MLWMLPLKRYFQFTGRSARAEFWQFFGACVIICLVAFTIDANSTNQNQTGIPTFLLIAICVLIVPLSAVLCRRLHDRSMSGRIAGAMIPLWIVGLVAGSINRSLADSFLHVPFYLVALACRWGTFGLLGFLLKEASVLGDLGDNQYGAPPTDTAANAPKLHEVVASVSDTARGFASKSAQPDRFAQLERLARLRQDGVLTEAEFQQQKAALLAEPGR